MIYRLSVRKIINGTLKYGLCLGAGFFSISNPAFALPFASNSSSFANYINTYLAKISDDGVQRYVSNLGGCEFEYTMEFGATIPKKDSAFCSHGYYTTVSPQGRKVCKIALYAAVKYEKGAYQRRGFPYMKGDIFISDITDCVMR